MKTTGITRRIDELGRIVIPPPKSKTKSLERNKKKYAS